jgi:hypothetical protein
MAVRITSLVSSGPLWISLTSGAKLRLEPGETSEEHPDVEVRDNPSVASLVGRGLIDVVSGGGGRRARAAAKTAAETPAEADVTATEQGTKQQTTATKREA